MLFTLIYHTFTFSHDLTSMSLLRLYTGTQIGLTSRPHINYMHSSLWGPLEACILMGGGQMERSPYGEGRAKQKKQCLAKLSLRLI